MRSKCFSDRTSGTFNTKKIHCVDLEASFKYTWLSVMQMKEGNSTGLDILTFSFWGYQNVSIMSLRIFNCRQIKYVISDYFGNILKLLQIRLKSTERITQSGFILKCPWIFNKLLRYKIQAVTKAASLLVFISKLICSCCWVKVLHVLHPSSLK